MKQNDAFPSNYIKAADIEDGEELQVTIAKVTIEGLKRQDGTEEQKPVVHFTDSDKQLVLNKTNFERIVAATGQEDTDNWAGKKITLYTEIVDAFGESKPAIRVKNVSGKQIAIDAFWKYAVDELFLTREEGLAVIKENGGDVVKALAAMKNTPEVPGESTTTKEINAELAAADQKQ
jgi:hypothetical protein